MSCPSSSTCCWGRCRWWDPGPVGLQAGGPMSIRTKTKKRLVILLIGAAVVFTLLSGAVFGRRWYLRRVAVAARQAGMDAAQKGDAVLALEKLTVYLGRFP